MTIEARPNRQIANGVHPTQAETLAPPPFVFPDGTTLKASDTQRKILETIFKAKEVYLNAKKTDPNVKETDYILSKPELCRRVYPGVPFRVASNDLTRASAALRHEMYEQAVPWQLIPVTPKLGKPSTYDIKKVPQSIPVEPKNGELITKPAPPTQSDTDVKKEEGQVGNERIYTIPDIANGLQISTGWAQSIVKAKYSGFGEYRKGSDGIKRRYYSAKEYEIITGHKPEALEIPPSGSPTAKSRSHRKGKNARDLTKEEKARKKTEQIRQEERKAARINWADEDKQISVDFTKAILTHLKDNADPKPLESLPKDFKVFIETYMPDNTSLEQLIENGDFESLKIFLIFSLKTTLTGILNNRNESQRGRTREANSTVTAYGGVEKLAEDIAEHFSIHPKKPQVGIRSTSSSERKFPKALSRF